MRSVNSAGAAAGRIGRERTQPLLDFAVLHRGASPRPRAGRRFPWRVPFGTNRPVHRTRLSAPAMPASAMGSARRGVPAGAASRSTASARSLPSFSIGIAGKGVGHRRRHLVAQHRGDLHRHRWCRDRRRVAPRTRAAASHSSAERGLAGGEALGIVPAFAGLALDQATRPFSVLCGDSAFTTDTERDDVCENADRLELGQRVVGRGRAADRGPDHHGAAGADHQRVAVGRLALHKRRRDRAAGTRLVLDDGRLAQRPGQLLREQPGDDVVASAGRKADDDAERLVRIAIALRQRDRRGRRRNGAGERRA